MGQVKSVIHCGLVSSTNTLALSMARSGAPSGTLVVARAQSAGRGREGRHFHSEPGGLYATLLLRPDGAPQDWMLLTSYAALCVCEAVERCCGARAAIKWPNDVRLGGKKLCGILVEGYFEEQPLLLVGMGCNVGQARFPDSLADIATSLRREGYDVSVDEFLTYFIRALGKWLLSPVDRDAAIESLRARSCVLGKEVTLRTPRGERRVYAVDLDAQTGGLVVEQEGVRSVLTSGEVSLRFDE